MNFWSEPVGLLIRPSSITGMIFLFFYYYSYAKANKSTKFVLST